MELKELPSYWNENYFGFLVSVKKKKQHFFFLWFKYVLFAALFLVVPCRITGNDLHQHCKMLNLLFLVDLLVQYSLMQTCGVQGI